MVKKDLSRNLRIHCAIACSDQGRSPGRVLLIYIIFADFRQSQQPPQIQFYYSYSRRVILSK